MNMSELEEAREPLIIELSSRIINGKLAEALLDLQRFSVLEQE